MVDVDLETKVGRKLDEGTLSLPLISVDRGEDFVNCQAVPRDGLPDHIFGVVEARSCFGLRTPQPDGQGKVEARMRCLRKVVDLKHVGYCQRCITAVHA